MVLLKVSADVHLRIRKVPLLFRVALDAIPYFNIPSLLDFYSSICRVFNNYWGPGNYCGIQSECRFLSQFVIKCQIKLRSKKRHVFFMYCVKNVVYQRIFENVGFVLLLSIPLSNSLGMISIILVFVITTIT